MLQIVFRLMSISTYLVIAPYIHQQTPHATFYWLHNFPRNFASFWRHLLKLPHWRLSFSHLGIQRTLSGASSNIWHSTPGMTHFVYVVYEYRVILVNAVQYTHFRCFLSSPFTTHPLLRRPYSTCKYSFWGFWMCPLESRPFHFGFYCAFIYPKSLKGCLDLMCSDECVCLSVPPCC